MKPLTLPKTSLVISLQTHGVFGTPEQWKTTDEANPSLFSYTLRTFSFELEKGKIYPRELTSKELRQQQEKGKKGGKKETKKEEGNAEEEKLKLEEEEERKREEEWNKKSEEDQKYRQFEDPFRSPQLRFQQNVKQQTIQGKKLVIFEQRVIKDKGEWVYFIKSPNVSEDELAKLKKAKPKTLNNANDLNSVVMRCWLDYSSLYSKDSKSVTQRCQLVQVDKTPQTPEPNLEKTYIKLTLTLGDPFIQDQDGVIGEKLISDPPEGEKPSEKVKAVQELREELKLGIQSLAMQFSAMFWKELNIYQEMKNINYFLNKKNDVTKRKEHFLYDFNVSGKYKILKDRLKKVIVHLCQKYFTKEMGNAKSFTGISSSSKDQFYSQIYTFLVSKYKQILQQLVFEKKENLRQVQVLSQSSQKTKVEKVLEEQFKQTAVQTVERIIQEYQALGDFQYGEKLYKNLVESHPSDANIKYSYAIYCIKNNLKRPEEALPFIEQYLSLNKDDLKVRLEYLLILMASEEEENCKKAWVFLRELIDSKPQEITNLMLASFLFGDLLKINALEQKYLVSAERAFLQQNGKVNQGKHQQNPIPSEIPSIKGLPSYGVALSQQEKDSLWTAVLELLMNLNLGNIVTKIQSKIKSANNSVFDLLKLTALLAEKNYEEFLTKAKQMYEKNRSQDILDLIVSHLLAHPCDQTQKYLKINLMKTTGEKQLKAILQLSFFYLNRQQYANSKACILKYIQKKALNGGLSWRILGKCEMNLGNLDQALDSFKKANSSDISNSENWLQLAKVYSLKGNFMMCNQCVNQYQSMLGKKCNGEQAVDLVFNLKEAKSPVLLEEKMRTQLIERLNLQEVS